MGVSVYYMAISPQSRLYNRLQQEKAMYILFAQSFSCQFEVISEEDDPEDIEETLEYLMEGSPDVFTSEAETRRLIDEFQAEIERADIRVAYLEKTHREIQDRLTQELNRRQSNDVSLLPNLFNGERYFVSGSFSLSSGGTELPLVSQPMVQQGARILSETNVRSLFEVDEDMDCERLLNYRGYTREEYHARDFCYWKALYLEAAAAQEEILVGYC